MIHHFENSRKSLQLYLNFSLITGTWGMEGPLPIACFPCGSRHLFWSHPRDDGAGLQEDGHALSLSQEQPSGCVTWGMNASFYMETKKEFCNCYWDKVAKECRPAGQDWQILRQVSPTQSHQSNGAAEKAVSKVRGLAGTYLAVMKTKSRRDNTLTNASVDDQTRSMDSHEIQCEKGTHE